MNQHKELWHAPIGKLGLWAYHSILMSPKSIYEERLRDSLKSDYVDKEAIVEGFFIAYRAVQPACSPYGMENFAYCAKNIDVAEWALWNEDRGSYREVLRTTTNKEDASSIIMTLGLVILLATTVEREDTRLLPTSTQKVLIQYTPWLVPYYKEKFSPKVLATLFTPHYALLEVGLVLNYTPLEMRTLCLDGKKKSVNTAISANLPSLV